MHRTLRLVLGSKVVRTDRFRAFDWANEEIH